MTSTAAATTEIIGTYNQERAPANLSTDGRDDPWRLGWKMGGTFRGPSKLPGRTAYMTIPILARR